MKKILNWNYKQLIVVILGIFLYTVSIKLFILPNNLYNGGTMGLSQLIRTFILKYSKININFDLATPIYYILNIPLFIVAYKKLGKIFFSRTFFCVTLNTIFLAIIPNIEMPLVDDILTNILIGGVLAGIGCGIALSVGASTGGTDIIGIIITRKFPKISVGNVGLSFNIFIYGLTGVFGGISTMIYSILYSIFDSIMVDKTHMNNICSSTYIISKNKPNNIINYIKYELNRDVTYWEAIGGYDNSKSYIIYTVLSKMEQLSLDSNLKELDKTAFVVSENNVLVKGNFQKKI